MFNSCLYKRNKTLGVVHLEENNPLLGGNRESAQSHHFTADYFTRTVKTHTQFIYSVYS